MQNARSTDSDEINRLLEKEGSNVAMLPVRTDKKYTPQELSIKIGGERNTLTGTFRGNPLFIETLPILLRYGH